MRANSLSGTGLETSQPSELQKWGHPTRQEAWHSSHPQESGARGQTEELDRRSEGGGPNLRSGDTGTVRQFLPRLGRGAAMEKREQGQVDTSAFTPLLG